MPVETTRENISDFSVPPGRMNCYNKEVRAGDGKASLKKLPRISTPFPYENQFLNHIFPLNN